MLKTQPLSTLLLASGIAFASSACGTGGTETQTIKVADPGTGGMNTSGGSSVGGSGGEVIGGAGTPATGGTDNGQAGSMTVGGAAGTAGAGAGADAGGSAGTAGGGGTGGAGEDPNKIVLFDGTPETFNSWVSVQNGGTNPWINNGDGSMTVQTSTGDIQTQQTFQDVFIHVEYVTPKITSAGGGQERGNSGVYLKGAYELQVLDSYGLPPAIDGCGAIYSIAAPLLVACHKEEEWNTYEIEFKAQVCDNGQKIANARFVEVKLNGMLIQQNVDADHTTPAGQPESCDPKGLLLQDHSSILPVSFRNIWAIPRN